MYNLWSANNITLRQPKKIVTINSNSNKEANLLSMKEILAWKPFALLRYEVFFQAFNAKIDPIRL